MVSVSMIWLRTTEFPRAAFELDGVVDCDSMVRVGACRIIVQGFIHVQTARMRNTLLPVEVVY
jgi:hypothetical protein